MHPTYHQKYFDNFDFRAIKNTWPVTRISVLSPKLREWGKAKEMEENLLSFNLTVIRRHISLYVFCLAPNKALDYYIKSHISLFSALQKKNYFVQLVPIHINCLTAVYLLSQCHPLMSAMKQQLSFQLHSEPLLSLDRVHPTHL